MEKKKYQLPRQFAEKWVAALRSGEYKQSNRAALLTECDEYCCLGVAGAICGIEKSDLMDHIMLVDSFADYVPIEIIGNANISGDDYNELVGNLCCRNDGTQDPILNPDGKQFTFPEIAQWLIDNVEFI